MKRIFYTNGSSRKIVINNQLIELRHASPAKLVGANSMVGVVISALNYLGKEGVSLSTIDLINKRLTVSDFAQVIENIGKMPGWMANLFYLNQKGQ
jgi:hypothetical protein